MSSIQNIIANKKATQSDGQLSLAFENKVRAFNSIRPYRETQADRVLKFYEITKPKTDPEISELSGLPLHVICARTNELLKRGFVVEWSSKRNEATGKLNTAYMMTSKGFAHTLAKCEALNV